MQMNSDPGFRKFQHKWVDAGPCMKPGRGTKNRNNRGCKTTKEAVGDRENTDLSVMVK